VPPTSVACSPARPASRHSQRNPRSEPDDAEASSPSQKDARAHWTGLDAALIVCTEVEVAAVTGLLLLFPRSILGVTIDMVRCAQALDGPTPPRPCSRRGNDRPAARRTPDQPVRLVVGRRSAASSGREPTHLFTGRCLGGLAMPISALSPPSPARGAPPRAPTEVSCPARAPHPPGPPEGAQHEPKPDQYPARHGQAGDRTQHPQREQHGQPAAQTEDTTDRGERCEGGHPLTHRRAPHAAARASVHRRTRGGCGTADRSAPPVRRPR